MGIALTRGVHTAPHRVPPLILVGSLEPRLPHLLTLAGFEVRTATTLDALCDLAARTSPDVVVVEELLEDASATMACKRLKIEPGVSRHLPILTVVTGAASPALRVAAIRVGVWDFLDRAATPDELAHKVSAHVEARRHFADNSDAEILEVLTGLRTRLGLARRARELASQSLRMNAGLFCVVFEADPRCRIEDLSRIVAQAARTSDVVGDGGDARAGVIAAFTDEHEPMRLASRIVEAVSSVARVRGFAEVGGSTPLISAGYDAFARGASSSFGPLVLLRNASSAVSQGEPDSDLPWLRRFRPSESSRTVHTDRTWSNA